MLSLYKQLEVSEKIMQQIETKLDELLVKKAPFQLPESARLNLVKAMPWLTLIGGILAALGVWSLYRVVTVVDSLTTYYNSLGYATPLQTQSVSPLLWVSLLMLAIEAIMFFVAFPALKQRSKKGWNILYWVSLLNVAYALIYLFAEMNLGSFIFSLIGSLVGLYVLFQIRSHYMLAGKAGSTTRTTPTTTTPPAAAK